MTLCNYWKVIPQFVPLNSLHAGIVSYEQSAFTFLKGSLYGKMSITYALLNLQLEMVSLDRAL